MTAHNQTETSDRAHGAQGLTPAGQPDADIYLPMEGQQASARAGGPRMDWPLARLRRRSFRRPVAILFRQIATPNYEMLWFLRKATRLGLDPIVVEHRLDRFCAHNACKRTLVTLPIIVGKDRHGRPITRRQKLIEHNSAEGQPLQALATRWGEGLVAYHHRKLRCTLGTKAPRLVDLSEVVDSAADGPAAYYADLLSLLTNQVFLFEDFVVDDQTRSFFERVVAPAYDRAALALGQRPQVVRLTHGHHVNSPYWLHYPSAMLDERSWLVPTVKHVDHAA